MQSLVPSQASDLEELISSIFLCGSLTATEYRWLITLSTARAAQESDKVLIARVLYGIRHGLFALV
ncbi:hypothetical protein NDA01_19580 [Trichocoleus desertorum AS-A10]|uniref:hypothetical protein n=1 Tax=Trichocoleus desertorum TaxID=1481672 RepID=UPI003297FC4B